MVRFSLRQLAFLSEAARCGGIAPAARNLNISPAAVSSALDKLEAVTGLTLFDRFPARGMRLGAVRQTRTSLKCCRLTHSLGCQKLAPLGIRGGSKLLHSGSADLVSLRVEVIVKASMG